MVISEHHLMCSLSENLKPLVSWTDDSLQGYGGHWKDEIVQETWKTSRELSSIFILELTIDWLALEHWPILERRDIPAKGLGEGTSAVTYVKHE